MWNKRRSGHHRVPGELQEKGRDGILHAITKSSEQVTMAMAMAMANVVCLRSIVNRVSFGTHRSYIYIHGSPFVQVRGREWKRSR